MKMNFLAILKVAVRALNRNKLRTALTMLGIIIGVGAVIALVSIGQGAQAMIQDQINGMGTNMMFIMPGNVFFGGASLGAGAASTLTEEDVEAMVKEIPTIAAASPIVRASGQLVFGNQNWFVQIQGANENFPLIRNWKVDQGDFFTDIDVRSADRVIVLGKTVADKLFSGVDPIGQMIRVRNLPFRVIGVLAAKGQSMVGQDQDDTAVVPYTTVQKKLLGQQIPSINQAMISAISQQASAVTEKQVGELLRQRHKIQPGQTDDFMVRNMTDVAQTSAQITTLMTVLLGSIATEKYTRTLLDVFGERLLFPGDTLALYTDGITESFSPEGEEFGVQRLIEAVRQNRDLSSQALLRSVVDKVQQFSPHEQHDDLTLIVAKCTGN